MRFLITDYDFPDVDLEQALFRDAGFELATAQCRTEDDLIAAARGCSGLLTQYVPVSDRVMAARPEVKIVSRMGAGFDTVDIDAARRRYLRRGPVCRQDAVNGRGRPRTSHRGRANHPWQHRPLEKYGGPESRRRDHGARRLSNGCPRETEEVSVGTGNRPECFSR